MDYFRITAYNKKENYSIIADSFGKFEKLWQFSSYLINKGFSIIEVGNDKKFKSGNMPKVSTPSNKIIIRATEQGEPLKENNEIKVGNKKYNIIKEK